MSGAVVGTSHNPLVGMMPASMRGVPVGVPISSFAPQARGLLVCRVNGEWLSRDSWDSLTRDGDVIEWHDVPQDNDTLRGVLQIALNVAGYYFGLGPIGTVLLNIGGAIALNALLPPQLPTQLSGPGETGDAYNTSLGGNVARLDQPIPRILGVREVNPPFAAQPYFEYRPKVGEADTTLDNEQYYYALFAIGVGEYDVIAKIGNTPITRFKDVILAQYLAPGQQPTTVQPNVVTAVEVANNVMESGRYVGGFAACEARRTCTAIGVDISATRGLGKAGGTSLTVSWRVEFRVINDFGQAQTPWVVIGSETRTQYTSTPQRWSVKYELTGGSPAPLVEPSRVEVRVVRTDNQDTDPAALHELAWIGLRAYLSEAAPLDANTAHYELVMRASSQLSQVASKDLRLIVQAYIRTLQADLTWAPSTSIERNPGWAALELITSTSWGMSKPDDRIDLQAFYDFAQTCAARQDRFDYAFDTTMNGWDALQLIARCGRARAFRRNGVISIARDESATLPVTMFSHRNCKPGIAINEVLRQRQSPDGVIIEYLDHRSKEWTAIECPCPGVTTMANPVIMRIPGIIGAKHAEREGRYEAANLIYRTRTVTWTTEMEGLLPAYMSPVAVQPDIPGFGQSGDVAFWDSGSLTASLSQKPDFSATPLYIWLQRDDGTLTEPIQVTPGPTEWDVVLASLPDFTLVVDDGLRERPKFLLGTLSTARELVRVTSIADGGVDDRKAQLFQLAGVIDDERVHTADNDLLPSPGEVQDPIGFPDPDVDPDAPPGDVLVIPRILDRDLYAITDSTVYTPDLYASASFGSNGKLTIDVNGDVTILTQEWNQFGEIEASFAAGFEIRATILTSFDGASPTTFTGTIGSWESLGTTRTWELRNEFVGASSDRNSIRIVLFEIREVSTGIVQDSATFDFRTLISTEVGGA